MIFCRCSLKCFFKTRSRIHVCTRTFNNFVALLCTQPAALGCPVQRRWLRAAVTRRSPELPLLLWLRPLAWRLASPCPPPYSPVSTLPPFARELDPGGPSGQAHTQCRPSATARFLSVASSGVARAAADCGTFSPQAKWFVTAHAARLLCLLTCHACSGRLHVLPVRRCCSGRGGARDSLRSWIQSCG